MPLHKVPLCAVKYVGDINSSATFKYDTTGIIQKQKEKYFYKQNSAEIDIYRNEKYIYLDSKDIDVQSSKFLYRNDENINILNPKNLYKFYPDITINNNKLLTDFRLPAINLNINKILIDFRFLNINLNTSKILNNFILQNINLIKSKNLKNNDRLISLNSNKILGDLKIIDILKNNVKMINLNEIRSINKKFFKHIGSQHVANINALSIKVLNCYLRDINKSNIKILTDNRLIAVNKISLKSLLKNKNLFINKIFNKFLYVHNQCFIIKNYDLYLNKINDKYLSKFRVSKYFYNNKFKILNKFNTKLLILNKLIDINKNCNKKFIYKYSNLKLQVLKENIFLNKETIKNIDSLKNIIYLNNVALKSIDLSLVNVYLKKVSFKKLTFTKNKFFNNDIIFDVIKTNTKFITDISIVNIKTIKDKFLNDLSIININKNIDKYLGNNYAKKIILNKKVVFLELTKRWWWLNATGPRDPIIVPNKDYLYNSDLLNNLKHEYLRFNTHPIKWGNNWGIDYDIPPSAVSIEIMIDMINIIGMVSQRNVQGWLCVTGKEGIQLLMELLCDWYNMDSSKPNEDYYRIYRWIRWEAEKVYFLDCETGLQAIGILLANLIDYVKFHHFNLVPFWRNLKAMDVERTFNKKASNNDLIKDLDKLKGKRHYFIETKNTNKKNIFGGLKNG